MGEGTLPPSARAVEGGVKEEGGATAEARAELEALEALADKLAGALPAALEGQKTLTPPPTSHLPLPFDHLPPTSPTRPTLTPPKPGHPYPVIPTRPPLPSHLNPQPHPTPPHPTPKDGGRIPKGWASGGSMSARRLQRRSTPPRSPRPRWTLRSSAHSLSPTPSLKRYTPPPPPPPPVPLITRAPCKHQSQPFLHPYHHNIPP